MEVQSVAPGLPALHPQVLLVRLYSFAYPQLVSTEVAEENGELKLSLLFETKKVQFTCPMYCCMHLFHMYTHIHISPYYRIQHPIPEYHNQLDPP